jgi:predicted CoA-binding protein
MSDTAQRILADYGTVAVVGLSSNPDKTAHAVPAFLQSAGWRVIPVHPSATKLLGEPAYASLSDVPDQVEVVEVFRPADEAPGIAEQAVAVGAKALWLQQGLVSAEARRIAEDAGLLYVEDRCMGKLAALWGIHHHEADH